MKKQNIQAEKEFFNEIAENNDHFDTISEDFYKEILNKIKPYLGYKVLDAGCGTGSFGFHIKKDNPNIFIYGIDLNQIFISLAAKKKIYDSLLCANIEDLNLFNISEFDTIICPYLLHHFPSMQDVINNFYIWLKQGGNLIIIDPNGSNLILRLSYIARLVLSKFIDTRNYASVNESHKSVSNFKKCLKKYGIFLIETFEHKGKENLKFFPFSFINTLVIIQKILLKIYKLLPFVKFTGSDIMIIAKKK